MKSYFKSTLLCLAVSALQVFAYVHASIFESDNAYPAVFEMHSAETLGNTIGKKHTKNHRSELVKSQDLRKFFDLYGGVAWLKSLKEEGKIIVGVIVARSGYTSPVLKVCKEIMEHDDRFVAGAISPQMITAETLAYFDGIIFPGGADNNPGHLEEFSLKDMPEEKRLVQEKAYQQVMGLVRESGVPIFGICLGAQHMVLNRGGMLKKAIQADREESMPLIPGTVTHFMALSPEEKKKALEECVLPEITIAARRYHTYVAVSETLDSCELTLEGYSRLGNAMAYSNGFDEVGVQFHPESNYDFKMSRYNPGAYHLDEPRERDRSTHLLDSFFELAEQHSETKANALKKGIPLATAIAQKKQDNDRLLKHLQECVVQIKHPKKTEL